VSVNHDRLWRRFWHYERHNIAEDMPRLKQLCLEEKWDEAYELMKGKIPVQGKGVYVNPFVPLGDIGIYPYHFDTTEVTNYRRQLDMDQACVKVSYKAGEYQYEREYFVSRPAGVMAVRLSADRAARTSGEVSLYRLLDSECQVAGTAALDELVLEGMFEEGVRFACVVRVLNRGGRLTSGLTDYMPPDGGPETGRLGYLQGPQKQPHWFRFREQPHPAEPRGVSTRFDAADEIVLLATAATDHEDAKDPAGFCRRILDQAPTDYEQLRAEHIRDHQKLYRRVSISLGEKPDQSKPTDELIQAAAQAGKAAPLVYEQLFNLGRYLGIAGGRPADPGQPYKAPINLQGIWNQDPRPAWDCDYHLDLNIEMCYWPLSMVNLVELTEPLVEWAYALLPQAHEAARDIYGVGGAFYNGVCDAENLGNADDLGFLSTGVNGWLAQMLWLVWEYNRDADQLRYKIYPILRAMGQFYEEFLVEDKQGRLVAVPSGSPEICPAGRKFDSMLSVTSTHDLELIRQVFTNLLEAGTILNMDTHKRPKWSAILEKLPYPTLNSEGRLLEWLEKDYQVTDPGHRHRSHLVGFCPGDRITAEDTPDYNEGVRKALARRHEFGDETSISIDKVWDAQMFARLYDSGKAMEKLNAAIRDNTMGNGLMCICEWREGGRGLRWFADQRVYQIEASFGMLAAITELLLQDRRGLIRLLPALPADWRNGYIKGLLARGGFEVDIRWENLRLTEARIKSRLGGPCRIKSFTTEGKLEALHYGESIAGKFENNIFEFPSQKDENYLIRPART
jgi:alpha-L-fucosidase 2